MFVFLINIVIIYLVANRHISTWVNRENAAIFLTNFISICYALQNEKHRDANTYN